MLGQQPGEVPGLRRPGLLQPERGPERGLTRHRGGHPGRAGQGVGEQRPEVPLQHVGEPRRPVLVAVPAAEHRLAHHFVADQDDGVRALGPEQFAEPVQMHAGERAGVHRRRRLGDVADPGLHVDLGQRGEVDRLGQPDDPTVGGLVQQGQRGAETAGLRLAAQHQQPVVP